MQKLEVFMDRPGRATGRPSPQVLRQVARVAAWLADETTTTMFACGGVSTAWNVRSDTDGSLLLLPIGDTDPGFAIIPTRDGAMEVLVADPEEAVELGLFESLDAALRAIADWIVSPRGRTVGHA